MDIVGKSDNRRRLPLNIEARKLLESIQLTPADDDVGAVFCGKRGPYTARYRVPASRAGPVQVSHMCIPIVHPIASATMQLGA